MAIPLQKSTLVEDAMLPLLTRTLKVDTTELGTFRHTSSNSFLKPWTFNPSSSESGQALVIAVDALQSTAYPVAFPTETVYGLGANALSSSSVKGIFTAKNRPSDNPLIVHISSLEMLRSLLDPFGVHSEAGKDPIPPIYHDLISKFWPGPLSILLPIPAAGNKVAAEVTAGQTTFAARMPNSQLALALIQLANFPLAAPSANASTRPSPTTADHVLHDLGGRIEYILDGGPCSVGVESTVVDGLSTPPMILRPGGIGIDELRKIKGWENVGIGYKDSALQDVSGPRAPGMKYKHYSPSAKVVLADWDVEWERVRRRIDKDVENGEKVGIIVTKRWIATTNKDDTEGNPVVLNIGPVVDSVARGLFSALRELDLRCVRVIYVEGISDADQEEANGVSGHAGEEVDEKGHTAAAIMNRLRKAAGERIHRSDT